MRRRALAVLRATRPRQWIKNLLVAAAPVAAADIFDASTFGRTVLAIALFTLAAGAVYLFNDAADVDVDRAHPTKRRRPVAAGEISVSFANRAAAVTGAVAVAGGVALDGSFGIVLAAYLAINVAYSRTLKHVPWVDLVVVASGFVLRAVGGGTATDVPLSAWFVAVICGGSLFMVTGKRTAELNRAPAGSGRAVLEQYSKGSLRVVTAASGATTVVAYAMWVMATNARVGWLAAGSLVMLAGALARYGAAIEDGRGEHPEQVFLHDLAFQVLAVAWAAFYLGAVYG